jgi:hypothetical protein
VLHEKLLKNESLIARVLSDRVALKGKAEPFTQKSSKEKATNDNPRNIFARKIHLMKH